MKTRYLQSLSALRPLDAPEDNHGLSNDSWDVKFNTVSPGSQLCFNSKGRKVHLHLDTTWLEEIVMKLSPGPVAAKGSIANSTLRLIGRRPMKDSTIFQVFLSNEASGPSGKANLDTSPGEVNVDGIVPSRYLSADIGTHGGSVSFAELKESGSVTVKSNGGKILGKTLHSDAVVLDSGGGEIVLQSLRASSAALSSGGSAVKIRNLMSIIALFNKNEKTGSAINLGACHVEKMLANCTSFFAKTLRCIRGGEIYLRFPGEINIGGFDGILSIKFVRGSKINILLTEGAKSLSLVEDDIPGDSLDDTHATEISLLVSPDLKVQLEALRECRDLRISTSEHTYEIEAKSKDRQAVITPKLQSTAPVCTISVEGNHSYRVNAKSMSWRQNIEAKYKR